VCVPIGHVKHVLPPYNIKYDAIKYPPTTLANYVLKKKKKKRKNNTTCTLHYTYITIYPILYNTSAPILLMAGKMEFFFFFIFLRQEQKISF
jgi:hypothetical protein